MAQYQLAFKRSTLQCLIQTQGAELPGGYINAGNFSHGDSNDTYFSESHVFYHHVRDLLYFQGPFGMQYVTFTVELPQGGNGLSNVVTLDNGTPITDDANNFITLG